MLCSGKAMPFNVLQPEGEEHPMRQKKKHNLKMLFCILTLIKIIIILHINCTRIGTRYRRVLK